MGRRICRHFFASKRCYLRQCCFFKRSHMACIKEIMWRSGLEINADRENTVHFKLKFKTIDTHQRLVFLIFVHSEMVLCRKHKAELSFCLSNSSSNCTDDDDIFWMLNQSFSIVSLATVNECKYWERRLAYEGRKCFKHKAREYFGL